MQLFTNYPTLSDFYQMWDKSDHTQHTAEDYALAQIIISTLKDETLEQTLKRLVRAFPAIHSYKKWKTPEVSGRYRFDTLKNVLLSIRSGNWRLRTFKNVVTVDAIRFNIMDLCWQLHNMLPDHEGLKPQEQLKQAA